MERFIVTSECYIRRGEEILFIHKGGKDMNTGKFLGIGGHMEKGESPTDSVVREIYEETGISRDELSNLRMRAVITFINPVYEDEYIMLLYNNKEDIYSLPLWEGDKRMFDEMFKDDRFFTMKLMYDGDVLKDVVVD